MTFVKLPLTDSIQSIYLDPHEIIAMFPDQPVNTVSTSLVLANGLTYQVEGTPEDVVRHLSRVGFFTELVEPK